VSRRYVVISIVVLAILIGVGGSSVWSSYVLPRRLMANHLGMQPPAVRILARDSQLGVRGGGVTWTMAITDGREYAMLRLCKGEGSFRKIHAAPVDTTTSPESSLPLAEMSAAAPRACLLSEWSASSKTDGGEIVLSSNLLQLSTWAE
jgi:hypothetical protein